MASKRSQSVANLDREMRALDLKRRGWTYEAIGNDLGVGRSAAHRIVMRALERWETPRVEELRKLEEARLDAMLIKAWEMYFGEHPFVSNGRLIDGIADIGANIAAGQLLLRIADRRAKLLGLDIPVPIKIQVLTEDVIDAELRRLAEDLGSEAVRQAALAAGAAQGGEPEVPLLP